MLRAPHVTPTDWNIYRSRLLAFRHSGKTAELVDGTVELLCLGNDALRRQSFIRPRRKTPSAYANHSSPGTHCVLVW